MADLAMDYCLQIVQGAVPVAFAFGMTNLIVNFYLRVAFGGRMEF